MVSGAGQRDCGFEGLQVGFLWGTETFQLSDVFQDVPCEPFLHCQLSLILTSHSASKISALTCFIFFRKWHFLSRTGVLKWNKSRVTTCDGEVTIGNLYELSFKCHSWKLMDFPAAVVGGVQSPKSLSESFLFAPLLDKDRSSFHLFLIAPSGSCLLDEALQWWEGAGCFVFALIGPQCHGFGPLFFDTHHLLEMVLNYSNLNLSKIGTLKWRLRRGDWIFSPRDFKCKENRTFELMNCLKRWGGLSICSSFYKN